MAKPAAINDYLLVIKQQLSNWSYILFPPKIFV